MGYRNGVQVASQSFDFKPDALNSNFVQAILNAGFKNVDSVTFAAPGLVQNAAGVVAFDNFIYDAYTKDGA